MRTSAIILGLVAAISGQTSFADGLYYGGGLAIHSSQSAASEGLPVSSEDMYAAIGATVGYRWDRPEMFLGVEADGSYALGSDFEYANDACSVEPAGPYYCEHSTTLRLRVIVGAPLGDFEGFASLGLAAMTGQGATSPDTTDSGMNTGYTIGVGLQHGVSAGTLRYELVYDVLDTVSTQPDGIYEPTFQSLSAKVSYLFQ